MADTKQKVMTAPLAVIKVNGKVIGKMKNIRVTESIQRGTVQGIGAFNNSEIPALKWDGTLSCSFYTINFNNQNELFKTALLRNVNTVQEFVDTVLLQEDGVTIDILKKVKDYTDENGIVKPKYEVFASIVGCFPNKESFDISEGQISGRDTDFQYLEPILFPL